MSIFQSVFAAEITLEHHMRVFGYIHVVYHHKPLNTLFLLSYRYDGGGALGLGKFHCDLSEVFQLFNATLLEA